MKTALPIAALVALFLLAAATPASDKTKDNARPTWVEPMKKVHARFTGAKGTFACFGDSITVTQAF